MAPSNKDSTNDEVVSMLKEALKSVNGNVNFDRMATKIGAPNGEAARKRLKRFFEKDEEPLVMTGSVLGENDGSAKKAASKTPKSAKSVKSKTTPATPAGDDGEDGDSDTLAAVTPKKNVKKPNQKKRKADVMDTKDENTDENETVALTVAIKTQDSSSELTSVVDTDDSATEVKTPKKKAKTVNPRTPRSAKKGVTPKAPRTPKSPLETTAKDEEEI